ncbi:MAG TPA: aldehyde dehydrogenase family protein [Candidatus Cloacimonetes bacterium]|nr:aldehyde dehydrogenase family protein [Candidatus Cloacimonadota bacterium]HEX37702.1 aldehyde dehydrogenase family protein [Candidatus Cloacimonadota bacterium]
MKMLINGQWIDKDEKIDVKNPLSGEVIDTVPAGTKEDVKKAIDAAVEGFEISKNMPVHERVDILYRAAQIMKDRQEELARIIATEGSKTIREARGEAARAVNTITLSAEEAKRVLGETIPFDSMPGAENRVGYYYRFPIGVIAAITPFNDPLNLVAHKLGPIIAGGNSCVLKPATVTPLSALKLGEILLEAGLPPKILNIVTGHGEQIGDALVTDERIRMVTFTGGPDAGKEIIKKAGLKKIGMELGSNTPVLVMDDCDIDAAVESCVSGAFWAVGQNCIGVQRLYVQQGIFDEFEKKFVERTRKMKVGYQLDEDTDMGPMITETEAKRVESWVKEAVEVGGILLTGGERDGAVVQPTVMRDVPKTCRLGHEEVFGPVVILYKINNLEEGIKEANDVDYGLHAGIFTNDIKTAFKAIKGIDVGGIMINDSSDYRIDGMPFGGVKNSGLGREGIKFALMEMTEPKVVCFNL